MGFHIQSIIEIKIIIIDYIIKIIAWAIFNINFSTLNFTL